MEREARRVGEERKGSGAVAEPGGELPSVLSRLTSARNPLSGGTGCSQVIDVELKPTVVKNVR